MSSETSDPNVPLQSGDVQTRTMSPVRSEDAEEGPKGPLKLISKGPLEWAYEMRPGAKLKEDQSRLVAEITGLLNHMYEFRTQPNAPRLMNRLADLFGATLDDFCEADLTPYFEEVEKTRKEFFRRCVKPAHRKKLNLPIGLTLLVLAGFVFLGGTADSVLSQRIVGFLGSPAQTVPFFFMIAGVLVGRLIYFGMAHGEKITSLEQFFSLERELSSPFVTLLFDIVTGFVACLLFVTGIVVIAIGGGDGADAAFSTLHVKDNAMLALAFGVLVGVAKAQFLKKMVDIARERMA